MQRVSHISGNALEYTTSFHWDTEKRPIDVSISLTLKSAVIHSIPKERSGYLEGFVDGTMEKFMEELRGILK